MCALGDPLPALKMLRSRGRRLQRSQRKREGAKKCNHDAQLTKGASQIKILCSHVPRMTAKEPNLTAFFRGQKCQVDSVWPYFAFARTGLFRKRGFSRRVGITILVRKNYELE
jgi:hypothetical protein